MKQLTWLAAERRLCTDGDSEEDHSPTSAGSQEEEEEEEEGPKGEESGDGRSSKAGLDEEIPSEEGIPRGGGGRCPGRGRGQIASDDRLFMTGSALKSRFLLCPCRSKSSSSRSEEESSGAAQ